MPINIDNGIPVIKVRFVKYDENDIYFLFNIDKFVAMSTSNLILYQWITTKCTHLVS